MKAHGFTGGLSLDAALEWEHRRVHLFEDGDGAWAAAADAQPDEEDGGELSARPGFWEAASLVVLVVAGTGLPILGWLVGITMVHLSGVWSQRDKTLALVGGVAAAAALVITAAALHHMTPLGLGPIGVLVLLGGAAAGWLGGVYLALRLF